MAGPTTTRTLASANVGPLFSLIDGLAYVKVTKADAQRAVVNPNDGRWVNFADPDEYATRPIGFDCRIFVPVFCSECYGTTEADYDTALTELRNSQNAFLVGMCYVYGSATNEPYPDSRKAFLVNEELAFSGACHPQPGRALFMHKPDKQIGYVQCYWHVHSRSSAKTYLYTCIAVSETPYAEGVVAADINKGLSLGTVGKHDIGLVTEECSLVTVPARPGCYCQRVASAECEPTMRKMGFSSIKNATLNAGLGDETSTAKTDEDAFRVDNSISGLVRSFETIIRDQATEMTVLKDVLDALKIQNGLFTRLVANPNDEDIRFTLQGAKDFTKRTGVKTQLSAGIESTDETHVDASRSMERGAGEPIAPMTLNQQHVEELLKLLQQQQQSQPLQLMSMMQQLLADPKQRDVARDAYGLPNVHHQQFDPSRLSKEQRRQIAMEYNREEDERRAATQQHYDKMLESLKSSIKDVIAEQHAHHFDKLTTQYEQKTQQRDTLADVARETPYKRPAKRASDESHDTDVRTLMMELRELTRNMLPTKQNQSDNATCDVREPETVTQTKEPTRIQAGLSHAHGDRSTRVEDFISAVVGQ